MDVIKVCSHCKGDGFWRQRYADVHPMQNVAMATAIWDDGYKVPVVYQHGVRPGQRPSMYEFKCIRCDGAGEFVWKRGMSLVPITPPETSEA